MSSKALLVLVAGGALGLAACGGGGGGDGGGGNGGLPPPGAVTFQVTASDLELVDRVTDEDIEADGLPLSGATVSLEP